MRSTAYSYYNSNTSKFVVNCLQIWMYRKRIVTTLLMQLVVR